MTHTEKLKELETRIEALEAASASKTQQTKQTQTVNRQFRTRKLDVSTMTEDEKRTHGIFEREKLTTEEAAFMFQRFGLSADMKNAVRVSVNIKQLSEREKQLLASIRSKKYIKLDAYYPRSASNEQIIPS